MQPNIKFEMVGSWVVSKLQLHSCKYHTHTLSIKTLAALPPPPSKYCTDLYSVVLVIGL